ncbi:MAG: hypothetical protein RJB65_560 [Actinomycetota bacterium]
MIDNALVRRIAAFTAPVLVIVVAVVHAFARNRMPLGDDGLIILRAQDVFTSDHPWFGTWTSASKQLGVDLNNPLPLHFELLGLLARPFGLVAGSVLGSAFVGILGATVAVRQGELLAGERGRVAASLAATGLAWTIGSELLVEPWQPHNLLLPFLAVLVACASWASGRPSSAAWAVGLGSMVMGAHLSFAYLMLGLWAVALVSCVLARRANGEPLLVAHWPASVVLVVAWSQAVWEQFAGVGEGNLSRVVRTLGSGAEPIGASLGTRITAEVVALPPWWLRPSFDRSIPATPFGSDGSLQPAGVAPFWIAAVALICVVALLAYTWRRSSQRLDLAMRSSALIALTALLLAWFTAVRMPANVLGLAPHQARWLWPIAIVCSVVLAGEFAGWLSERGRVSSRAVLSGTAVAMAALVVWSVVPYEIDQGPSATRGSNEAVRSLVDQLETVVLPGPTRFDETSLWFAEPYSGPVFAVLFGNDQPLRLGDEGWIRQVGESRRATGDEEWVLRLVVGQEAVDLAEGEEIVAGAEGPDGLPVALVLAPAD